MGTLKEINAFEEIRSKAPAGWKSLELDARVESDFLAPRENGVVHLVIPKNFKVKAPVSIVFRSPAGLSGFVFEPKILVHAGENSSCRLLIRYEMGESAEYLSTLKSEVYLDKNAKLEYLEIKTPPKRGFHFSSGRFYLKSESELKALSFVKAGGGISAEETQVFLEGEKARVDLKGLSILTQDSKYSQRASVFHQAPHCLSRQFYKNILSQSAVCEFSSLVTVKQGAFGSDSNQMNRNLLLSDQARASSRPELRIDADDVVCAHGSATGQLEKDELFYLRSRGFSEKQARLALVDGFAEEILQSIEEISVKNELERIVEQTLHGEVGL